MELDTNIKVIEENFREGKFINCESDILKLLEIAKNKLHWSPEYISLKSIIKTAWDWHSNE